VAILDRLLRLFPGRTAPVDFRPLSAEGRARAEAFLARPARPVAPRALAETCGAAFESAYQRVLEEVRRRCPTAEIWQNFYLDLLDEEGASHDEGEGVGADPVEPDEELRRLLAGVSLFPQVRARFAWEIGYHLLRHALSRGDPGQVRAAATAAVEDFLLAYSDASGAEARVSAAGDLAGALMLLGRDTEAKLLCDYVAAAISSEEAVRQELHRLRREGASYVRESYGGR